MLTNRVLNWKKEPEDSRDFKFSDTFKVSPRTMLPMTSSVEGLIPDIWDQLNIGSCVAFSTDMELLYQSRIQNREINPSKLFTYYITRDYEGTVDEDSGCYIRDAFKCLNKTGVCKEETWPYIESKFKVKPPDIAYQEASKTILTTYHKLDNTRLEELKTCIAELKKPFVFGFNVYTSFMYGNWSSIMPIPNKAKESILGGHAIIAVAYDDNKQAFKIKNSWGKDWKEGGSFWMPYSFITSQECSDFWVIEQISDSVQPKPIDPTVDIRKIFKSKKDLDSISKVYIVRIGQFFNLGVDINFTKKKNLDIVSNYLNLI